MRCTITPPPWSAPCQTGAQMRPFCALQSLRVAFEQAAPSFACLATLLAASIHLGLHCTYTHPSHNTERGAHVQECARAVLSPTRTALPGLTQSASIRPNTSHSRGPHLHTYWLCHVTSRASVHPLPCFPPTPPSTPDHRCLRFKRGPAHIFGARSGPNHMYGRLRTTAAQQRGLTPARYAGKRTLMCGIPAACWPRTHCARSAA